MSSVCSTQALWALSAVHHGKADNILLVKHPARLATVPSCLYVLQCTGPPKDVIACATGGAAARAELGLADNYYDTSAGQRERMLKTTEKLDKTGDRISQGRAQLAETEASLHVALHARVSQDGCLHLCDTCKH